MRGAELNAAQQARLAELAEAHHLDAAGRQALEDMARLRNLEADWRATRLAAVHVAAELLAAGRLRLDDVTRALDISPATWYRRMAELRSTLAGRGGAAAEAAGDQAAAAAREAGL